MENSSYDNTFSCFLLLSLLFPICWTADDNNDVANFFFQCLSSQINPPNMFSSGFYTRTNASFERLLETAAENPRFVGGSVVKPLVIFTPFSELDVQAAVACARQMNVHLRILSGGHDYEALSYASMVTTPFIVIDLKNLRSINVNLQDNSVWVQSGATTGELYYQVADQSNNTKAFPAGVCTSLGIGGHIVGGGYGTLLRKYGLAVDHALDARVVDPNGYLLDRESMGEDVFWAIRGGGGHSFGILTAWKVGLVPVPQNVTVLAVGKTLQQGATELMVKWQQIADKIDDDLFTRVVIFPTTPRFGKKTITVMFQGLYLGGAGRLLQITRRNFPQLGLTRNDCIEMSWIQSILYFVSLPNGTPIDVLLEGKFPGAKRSFKAKSDFFTETIPSRGLEQLWRYMYEDDGSVFIMNPFGGFMKKVPQDYTPYPHRNVRYMMQYLTYWDDKNDNDKHINWIRKVYDYMSKFASNDPRQAYFNYRDSDLGINKSNKTSFEEARDSWGGKYFMNNFERLSRVKTNFDSDNFYWNEQSIPLLY